MIVKLISIQNIISVLGQTLLSSCVILLALQEEVQVSLGFGLRHVNKWLKLVLVTTMTTAKFQLLNNAQEQLLFHKIKAWWLTEVVMLELPQLLCCSITFCYSNSCSVARTIPLLLPPNTWSTQNQHNEDSDDGLWFRCSCFITRMPEVLFA